MQTLFAVRKREETKEFKDIYRHRAGIEGLHSQGVRTMGLRRSHYLGLRKTHVTHIAIATAVNVRPSDQLAARRRARTDPHLSL